MVKYGNKLESSRKDGILANTDNIYDKRIGEMQEAINQRIASVSPADEEDLTKTTDEEGRSVTKFADRSYSPSNFSGKGYKILRKNIQKVSLAVVNISVNTAPTSDGYVSFIINGIETHVDLVASTDNTIDLVAQKIATKLSDTMTEYEVSQSASSVTLTRKFGGAVSTSSSFSSNSTGASCTISDTTKSERRNILTQSMVNVPNTIYEIRYDFNINGNTIEIPEGCSLNFIGGKISEGKLIGNFTSILYNTAYIFDNIVLEGTFTNDSLSPENFGVISNSPSSADRNISILNNVCDFLKDTNINTLKFNFGDYYISSSLRLIFENKSQSLTIDGSNGTIKAATNFTDDSIIYINYAYFSTITTCNVKNIQLDCNSLCGGIYIGNGNCIKIHDITITKLGDNKVGIKINSGNELLFSKSRIIGFSKVESFGIQFNTSDCTASDIIMIDVNTAIYQPGSSNNYFNIHAWISEPSLFQGSKFLLMGTGFAYLSGCSCDTYQIAIYTVKECFISFSDTVFFQNTDVVNGSGETSASIIIAEKFLSSYSFTGCCIYKYSFQHFSNNDNEILKKCNFSGSNVLGTFHPFYNDLIKDIPYASYDDIYGVYKDGIITSGTMRKIPKSVYIHEGNLYRLYPIDGWQGRYSVFFGTYYNEPFMFILSALNAKVKVRSLFGNVKIYIYVKNNLLYLKSNYNANCLYNRMLCVSEDGFTDLGKKEIDETYEKIEFDKIIGTSDERPSNPIESFEYYDKTLKKKILWNGAEWVNMDGTALV